MSDASPEVTAACGAFLLVSFADARVVDIEEQRFLAGVVNEPSFKPFRPAELADEYTRLLVALGEDYEATEAEILSAVRATRRNARAVEAVKVAARHAIIADQRLKPQEDLALARLAGALGIDADEL